MTGYSAFGLVVSSNIRLPGLPEVERAPADCVFALGRSPIDDRPTGRVHRLRRPNGTVALAIRRVSSGYLVRFPGLAVYRVSADGRTVSCTRQRRVAPEAVGRIFLAHVLPMALSVRGRLVLHASAVETPHGAIAFLGAAGQGKSTLSASFVRRAFPLIADDGLLIDDRGSALTVVPSYPEIRLWPDVLSALGHDGVELHDVGPRAGKKRFCVDRGPWPFSRDPVRVRRIYVLGPPPAKSQRIGIAAVEPREAFIELVKHTYRLDLDGRARLRDEFESIGRIAARPFLVYRLAFPRDLSRLPAVQAAILEHCAA